MKRLIAALALVLLTLAVALAQQPANTVKDTPATTIKPTAPQPSTEQKARLMTLAKAWTDKAREADGARDKYVIELLATLAELGLKPSETSVTFNEKGEPVFNRIEPQAAQKAPATTPKTEAKP